MKDPHITTDGRLPIAPDDRVFVSHFGFGATCVAFGSAIWVFMIGGYLPLTGATRVGIMGYIAGLIVGFVPVMLSSGLPSFRTGLDTIDACKSAFGQRGAVVPLIGVLIAALGWSCVLMAMIARGVVRLLSEPLGVQDSDVSEALVIALSLLLIVLCWWLVHGGVRLLQRVNDWVGPGLLVVAVFSLVLLVQRFGIASLWMQDLPADRLITDDPLRGLSYALELGMATSLAAWPFLGGLFRQVKYRRHVVTPSMVGLTVLGGGFGGTVAALASAAFQETDPLLWLISLAGPYVGSVIVVALLAGNLAVMGILVYLGSLALRQMSAVNRMQWGKVIALSLVPALFAAFNTLWVINNIMSIITYVSMVFVGVTAVTLVDYFFLRRGTISLSDIFAAPGSGKYWFWRGINFVAIASVALSACIYLILYNPITLRSSDLFRYLGASVPAMLVGGLSYYLLMRIVIARTAIGGYPAAFRP